MVEDEILTMEPVDEPRKAAWLDPGRARLLFLGLAGLAGAALLVAVLAVVLAPAGAAGILVGALVVLALVVVAEVALLLLAKPGKA